MPHGGYYGLQICTLETANSLDDWYQQAWLGSMDLTSYQFETPTVPPVLPQQGENRIFPLSPKSLNIKRLFLVPNNYNVTPLKFFEKKEIHVFLAKVTFMPACDLVANNFTTIADFKRDSMTLTFAWEKKLSSYQFAEPYIHQLVVRFGPQTSSDAPINESDAQYRILPGVRCFFFYWSNFENGSFRSAVWRWCCMGIF